jgi:hypothetical protein
MITKSIRVNIPINIIVQRLEKLIYRETLIRTDLHSNIPFRGTIDNNGFKIRKTNENLKFYPVKLKGKFDELDNSTDILIYFYPEPIFNGLRVLWIIIFSILTINVIISSFLEPRVLIAIPFLMAFVLLEEYIFRKGFKKGIQLSKEIIDRVLS